MREIKQDKVPVDTKERLLAKAQEYITRLNNGDPLAQQELAEDKPAIIVMPFGENTPAK